ncbi:hypothetical protein R1sor_020003 [Riccia sorocarpa]|uniref:Germin-like protein n=1 Tax=Riccia sorocarpa TaxID=122646 RepID=A0ABD3IIC1_9MARC
MGFSWAAAMCALLLCLFGHAALRVDAADPEEIRDFAPPPPGTALDGNYFTSTRLRNSNVEQKGTFANVTAVNTLFIIEGTLEVGLIDTTAPVPMLFTQTLHKNDIFLFPRGLVHFQINKSKQTVRAYASFSSTNPGLVSLPRTLFGVNTDIEVLIKSFQVSPYVIKALSAPQEASEVAWTRFRATWVTDLKKSCIVVNTVRLCLPDVTAGRWCGPICTSTGAPLVHPARLENFGPFIRGVET